MSGVSPDTLCFAAEPWMVPDEVRTTEDAESTEEARRVGGSEEGRAGCADGRGRRADGRLPAR
ncbi:hypothetical protein ASA1KI_28350 [Opitutales bacterium ASA1]|nr:hypothetical protein ASA1KI_28350 [Opitutales bacterium ASA1]